MTVRTVPSDREGYFWTPYQQLAKSEFAYNHTHTPRQLQFMRSSWDIPFLYLQNAPPGTIILSIKQSAIEEKGDGPARPESRWLVRTGDAGPSLPLSEHPATNRRGAPPTAHVKSACIHLQASRVAPRKLSVPGNAGQEGFSFFTVISRRKKQTCWTSI